MRMLVAVRYWFWSKVHDALEEAWHWVYYHKLLPVTPKFSEQEPVLYTKILEKEEVTIYRSNRPLPLP